MVLSDQKQCVDRMVRRERFQVERSLPSERLDSFLRQQFPEISRGTWQRLIAEGQVRVNGRVVKPTHHPRIGEEVTIVFLEPRAAEARPENIPIDVLFEDDALLVLNKPPGLVVHPAAGHPEHTLVNALLYHCAGHLSGIGGVARPGVVHRLDKDPRVCLVVAKTDAAHAGLAEQFAARRVHKVYHAIVCGQPASLTGEVSAPIGRHPTERKRMRVTASRGRTAQTSYQVLEMFRFAALVQATIHTGRTHQIRVHFQHLGCPVAGDCVYGARQNKRLAELTGYAPSRQMLHARVLGFVHPVTQETKSFQAPWPEDFSEALQALRTAV